MKDNNPKKEGNDSRRDGSPSSGIRRGSPREQGEWLIRAREYEAQGKKVSDEILYQKILADLSKSGDRRGKPQAFIGGLQAEQDAWIRDPIVKPADIQVNMYLEQQEIPAWHQWLTTTDSQENYIAQGQYARWIRDNFNVHVDGGVEAAYNHIHGIAQLGEFNRERLEHEQQQEELYFQEQLRLLGDFQQSGQQQLQFSQAHSEVGTSFQQQTGGFEESGHPFPENTLVSISRQTFVAVSDASFLPLPVEQHGDLAQQTGEETRWHEREQQIENNLKRIKSTTLVKLLDYFESIKHDFLKKACKTLYKHKHGKTLKYNIRPIIAINELVNYMHKHDFMRYIPKDKKYALIYTYKSYSDSEEVGSETNMQRDTSHFTTRVLKHRGVELKVRSQDPPLRVWKKEEGISLAEYIEEQIHPSTFEDIQECTDHIKKQFITYYTQKNNLGHLRDVVHSSFKNREHPLREELDEIHELTSEIIMSYNLVEKNVKTKWSNKYGYDEILEEECDNHMTKIVKILNESILGTEHIGRSTNLYKVSEKLCQAYQQAGLPLNFDEDTSSSD